MASDQTAKISSSEKDNEHHTLHGALNLLNNIKLPHLPGHGKDKPKDEGECAGVLPVPESAERSETANVRCQIISGSTLAQHSGVCIWECCQCCTAPSWHKDSTRCAVLLCAAASAATLSEVAGIITTLAKDHLGSLLVHPGHATVGVYYLAKRHEVWCAAYLPGCLAGDRHKDTSCSCHTAVVTQAE